MDDHETETVAKGLQGESLEVIEMDVDESYSGNDNVGGEAGAPLSNQALQPDDEPGEAAVRVSGSGESIESLVAGSLLDMARARSPKHPSGSSPPPSSPDTNGRPARTNTRKARETTTSTKKRKRGPNADANGDEGHDEVDADADADEDQSSTLQHAKATSELADETEVEGSATARSAPTRTSQRERKPVTRTVLENTSPKKRQRRSTAIVDDVAEENEESDQQAQDVSEDGRRKSARKNAAGAKPGGRGKEPQTALFTRAPRPVGRTSSSSEAGLSTTINDASHDQGPLEANAMSSSSPLSPFAQRPRGGRAGETHVLDKEGSMPDQTAGPADVTAGLSFTPPSESVSPARKKTRLPTKGRAMLTTTADSEVASTSSTIPTHPSAPDPSTSSSRRPRPSRTANSESASTSHTRLDGDAANAAPSGKGKGKKQPQNRQPRHPDLVVPPSLVAALRPVDPYTGEVQVHAAQPMNMFRSSDFVHHVPDEDGAWGGGGGGGRGKGGGRAKGKGRGRGRGKGGTVDSGAEPGEMGVMGVMGGGMGGISFLVNPSTDGGVPSTGGGQSVFRAVPASALVEGQSFATGRVTSHGSNGQTLDGQAHPPRYTVAAVNRLFGEGPEASSFALSNPLSNGSFPAFPSSSSASPPLPASDTGIAPDNHNANERGASSRSSLPSSTSTPGFGWVVYTPTNPHPRSQYDSVSTPHHRHRGSNVSVSVPLIPGTTAMTPALEPDNAVNDSANATTLAALTAVLDPRLGMNGVPTGASQLFSQMPFQATGATQASSSSSFQPTHGQTGELRMFPDNIPPQVAALAFHSHLPGEPCNHDHGQENVEHSLFNTFPAHPQPQSQLPPHAHPAFGGALGVGYGVFGDFETEGARTLGELLEGAEELLRSADADAGIHLDLNMASSAVGGSAVAATATERDHDSSADAHVEETLDGAAENLYGSGNSAGPTIGNGKGTGPTKGKTKGKGKGSEEPDRAAASMLLSLSSVSGGTSSAVPSGDSSA